MTTASAASDARVAASDAHVTALATATGDMFAIMRAHVLGASGPDAGRAGRRRKGKGHKDDDEDDAAPDKSLMGGGGGRASGGHAKGKATRPPTKPWPHPISPSWAAGAVVLPVDPARTAREKGAPLRLSLLRWRRWRYL